MLCTPPAHGEGDLVHRLRNPQTGRTGGVAQPRNTARTLCGRPTSSCTTATGMGRITGTMRTAGMLGPHWKAATPLTSGSSSSCSPGSPGSSTTWPGAGRRWGSCIPPLQMPQGDVDDCRDLKRIRPGAMPVEVLGRGRAGHSCVQRVVWDSQRE